MPAHSFERRFDRRSFGEPLKKLRAVPIIETHEPLVDLRDVCPQVILNPGCLPFLRHTVALMVNRVQELLPDCHTLVVGTCLRTPEMQRSIRDSVAKDQMEKHPEWSKATLNRMLNRMVAPPDDISPPPHTTGAAIDVGVKTIDGTDIDFHSPFDFWEGAPTYFHKLNESARTNRLMLIEAMESAGFTNYVGEWWHWSYGDQGWALRTGHEFAYYGTVILPNAEALKIPELTKEPEKEEAAAE